MRLHYQNISRFWRQRPYLRIVLLVAGLVSGRFLTAPAIQQKTDATESSTATLLLHKQKTLPQKDRRHKPHNASTDSTGVEIIYGIVGTSADGN